MPLPSGTTLGRYEIRSPIGKGGMGEVYLAYDTQLRRQVAIKLLPAEFTQNKLRTAATEFQKILDHRDLMENNVLVPLAHLGLARAFALIGDTVKSRTAYNEFLNLWKDADPDIPILQQAKAEYGKLK